MFGFTVVGFTLFLATAAALGYAVGRAHVALQAIETGGLTCPLQHAPRALDILGHLEKPKVFDRVWRVC